MVKQGKKFELRLTEEEVKCHEDIVKRRNEKAISDEARVCFLNIACQKPKDLGLAQELWTSHLCARICTIKSFT